MSSPRFFSTLFSDLKTCTLGILIFPICLSAVSPLAAKAQIFIANNPNDSGHFRTATIERFSGTGERSVLSGYSPSGFVTVEAVAFDSAGNLYAAVSNEIIKFGPDGSSSVIVPNGGDYRWNDLATTASGGIYATASSNSSGEFSILKISSDGAITEKVTGLNGDLMLNSSLAVDSVGNLYVSSASANAVFRFNDAGAMTKIADITRAFALAVDSMDNIYVGGEVDSTSGVKAILKITGTTVENFVVAPSDDFYPVSLAVDSANNIFVSSFPNSVNGSIYKFNSDGEGGVFYRWAELSGPGDLTTWSPAAIPEPKTYAMMIFGTISIVVTLYRRRFR